MGRSIRYCAELQCEAEAIYGAFCIAHQMERDPAHLAVVSPSWAGTEGDLCQLTGGL